MFVEHAELFRCLVPHEDGWLVAASRRTAGRRIVDGTLGCPICRASYPIADGVVWMGVEPGTTLAEDGAAREDGVLDDLVFRAAALLGLEEPGGAVALVGAWGAAAPALVAMTRVAVVVLNVTAAIDVPAEGVTLVRAPRLPLGAAVLRGAAVGAAEATPDVLASAAHAVRHGGRVVGPAGAPLPADLRELARDARDWVAERAVVTSAPVPLRMLRAE